ncbi:hypothetical protein D3C84_531890 [compost metagenome]
MAVPAPSPAKRLAKVVGRDATRMSLSSASPAGVGVAVAFCNPADSSSVTSAPVATTPKALAVTDVVTTESLRSVVSDGVFRGGRSFVSDEFFL